MTWMRKIPHSFPNTPKKDFFCPETAQKIIFCQIRLPRVVVTLFLAVADDWKPKINLPGLYPCKNYYSAIYCWIYQNVAQENLATLASTPQNQTIN